MAYINELRVIGALGQLALEYLVFLGTIDEGR
jgi:hypothetical protein